MTAQFDEDYVRNILQAVTSNNRGTFYRLCQPDVNAGYRAEVNEAWRRRFQSFMKETNKGA